MTPAATFESESRSAKPIARPAAPRIARKLVVGTPSAVTAVSATSTSNAMEMTLPKKRLTVSSTPTR